MPPERLAVSARGRETLTGPLCTPSSDSSRWPWGSQPDSWDRSAVWSVWAGVSVSIPSRAPACVSCMLRPQALPAQGCLPSGTSLWLLSPGGTPVSQARAPSVSLATHSTGSTAAGAAPGPLGGKLAGPLWPLWPARTETEWGPELFTASTTAPTPRDQKLPCLAHLHTTHLPTGTTCLFQHLWGHGAAETVANATHHLGPLSPPKTHVLVIFFSTFIYLPSLHC